MTVGSYYCVQVAIDPPVFEVFVTGDREHEFFDAVCHELRHEFWLTGFTEPVRVLNWPLWQAAGTPTCPSEWGDAGWSILVECR